MDREDLKDLKEEMDNLVNLVPQDCLEIKELWESATLVTRETEVFQGHQVLQGVTKGHI